MEAPITQIIYQRSHSFLVQRTQGSYPALGNGVGPEVGVPTPPHHLQRGCTRPGNTCSVLGGMSFNIEAMRSLWPSHPQQLSLLPPRFHLLPGWHKTKEVELFLVVQWLRIPLPVQETQVQSLLREDSTGGATKPFCYNYWGPCA